MDQILLLRSLSSLSPPISSHQALTAIPFVLLYLTSFVLSELYMVAALFCVFSFSLPSPMTRMWLHRERILITFCILGLIYVNFLKGLQNQITKNYTLQQNQLREIATENEVSNLIEKQLYGFLFSANVNIFYGGLSSFRLKLKPVSFITRCMSFESAGRNLGWELLI